MQISELLDKYNSVFAPNTTGDIRPEDLQDFTKDITETFGTGNFKGLWLPGQKTTDEFWISGNKIWKTKQSFNSATAPTAANAYWELILDTPPTYTDEQALASAKTNIGTGSGQFAEGNHKHYFSYLEVTGDYTITAADHNRILIYNSVNPATFTMNDISQTGLNVIVHQIGAGMVTFVKSVTGNHAFNVAGGGANATTRGLGGTVVLSSYFTNKYSWLYTYRGGADSAGGAATTGTAERSWQVGQGTAGTTSTFEAAGTANDIAAVIKPKGAGYAKLEGVNYTIANNKVLILDTSGNVKAEYEIAEEQVSVPATLNQPGIAGTWAREAGFLYFCYGAGWEKLSSVSSDLNYGNFLTAVPTTPTTPAGQFPGQIAYDTANARKYEWTGSQWVWITLNTTF